MPHSLLQTGRLMCLQVGAKKLFCGPESFTPDLSPIVGEVPELRGYHVAAGMNSIGILTGGGIGRVLAHSIVNGAPDVDVTAMLPARLQPYQATPTYRGARVVESLGKVPQCYESVFVHACKSAVMCLPAHCLSVCAHPLAYRVDHGATLLYGHVATLRSSLPACLPDLPTLIPNDRCTSVTTRIAQWRRPAESVARPCMTGWRPKGPTFATSPAGRCLGSPLIGLISIVRPLIEMARRASL